MLPNREFLDSLLDHDDERDTNETTNFWSVKNLAEQCTSFLTSPPKSMLLPRNLVLLWSDVVQMVANYGPPNLLSDFLFGLMSGMCQLANCSFWFPILFFAK